MSLRICYDLTRLDSQLGNAVADGFIKVDLAYARHLVETEGASFVISRGGSQRAVSRQATSEILQRATGAQGQQLRTASSAFDQLRAAILKDAGAGAPEAVRIRTAPPARLPRHRRAWRELVNRLGSVAATDANAVPPGAVYLNVTQHLFERRETLAWLGRRPDVKPVFLVHDLLPLDVPEFFPHGYAQSFERRIAPALARASALVVTTDAVRTRVAEEMDRRGLAPVPILSAPLPSMLGAFERADLVDSELGRVPYFVMVGTIEPRKNHLFMLHVWRRLVAAAITSGARPPKLAIVGRRGWENEQVLDMLERSRALHGHVIETDNLPSGDLARLLANARALLMPSFEEGYGLPMVEALALGTPVVANDGPVFREVTQGFGYFANPVDGDGWARLITMLSQYEAPANSGRLAKSSFVAPSTVTYFEQIGLFLAQIAASKTA